MQKIPLSEIHIRYGIDRTGYTFHWKDRFFRAVYPQKEQEIRALLDCGLLQKLIQKKLFPETTVTDYCLPDSNLILEHHRIKTLTSAAEWSFEMFKDAALVILEVNETAMQFGYQLIDAHPGNILFEYAHPYFIDIGSFIRHPEPNYPSWRAYAEFCSNILLPLKLRKRGFTDIAGLFTFYGQYDSLFLLQYRWIPMALSNAAVFFLKLYLFYYKALYAIDNSYIDIFLSREKSPVRKKLVQILYWCKKKHLFPFATIHFSSLKKYIFRQKITCSEMGKEKKLDEKIMQMIRNSSGKNLLMILNGESRESLHLVQSMPGKQLVVADMQSSAIDAVYRALPQEMEHHIDLLVYDFCSVYRSADMAPFEKRFLADTVFVSDQIAEWIALRYRKPEVIASRLKSLTRNLLLIECPPECPELPGYKLDTLQEAFESNGGQIEKISLTTGTLLKISFSQKDIA